MEKLMRKDAKVDLWGSAVIPRGVQHICPRAFDGNKALRAVHIPGTVKLIDSRAFADCPNLKTVILDEGIETIAGNVFTGCSALTKLVLPDSIRELDGWAFYQFTGLQAPAYSRSGTILYCYPCTAKEPVFTVPDHVTKINAAAFLGNPHLQQVNLPESITVLHRRSFLDCGLRRIVIPASVKRIEQCAFWSCKDLQEVVLLGDDTVIADGAFFRCPWGLKLTTAHTLRLDERLHLFGSTFLKPVRLDIPEKDHSQDRAFLRLAQACAAGDADAMWAFADYFAGLGDHPFHACAANFWRYRAYQYGCTAALSWLEQWLADHPEKAMPSVFDENLDGTYSGERLRAAGFLFFDPERSYSLSGKDADGVVEVNAWCGDDGPDEDGFGREEYYDWWFLDEHLNPVPGVDMIHSYSRQDKRANEAKFQAYHDWAAAAIRNK